MTSEQWRVASQSYRRGWVEGHDYGERDALLLLTGCDDLAEYERGFADGVSERDADARNPD